MTKSCYITSETLTRVQELLWAYDNNTKSVRFKSWPGVQGESPQLSNLDFLTYKGTNPQEWLKKCHEFLASHQIFEEPQVAFVEPYDESRAKTWTEFELAPLNRFERRPKKQLRYSAETTNPMENSCGGDETLVLFNQEQEYSAAPQVFNEMSTLESGSGDDSGAPLSDEMKLEAATKTKRSTADGCGGSIAIDLVTQIQDTDSTPQVFEEMCETTASPSWGPAIEMSSIGGLQEAHNNPSKSRPNSEFNNDESQSSMVTKKTSEGNPFQISRYLDKMDVVGFDPLKLKGVNENAASKWENGVYNINFLKLEGINITANRKGLKPWTEVVTGFQGGRNLISALIAYEITVPNAWVLFVYLDDINVKSPDSLNWLWKAISPFVKAKSVGLLVNASSVRGVVHITSWGYYPIRLSLLTNAGAWEYCATDFHENASPGLHTNIGVRLVALSITKSRNIPKNWATRVTSFKGGTSFENFIIIPWQVPQKLDQKLMRSEELISAARSCDAPMGIMQKWMHP